MAAATVASAPPVASLWRRPVETYVEETLPETASPPARQADGCLVVPDVLRPWMGGIEVIGPEG